MHRLLQLIVLLAASCSKAPDPIPGVKLIYTADQVKSGFVIALADNGDYRIDTKSGGGWVRRSGIDYVFGKSLGKIYAAKTADLDAVEAEENAENAAISQAEVASGKVKEAQALKPGQAVRIGNQYVVFRPPPTPHFDLIAGGPTEVGGQRGQLWTIHQKGGDSARDLEAVISTDPALAAAGKLFARSAAPKPGKDIAPVSLNGRIAELFAKGTVLRLWTLYVLERVDRTPLSPEAFALPGAVTDRATLKRDADARVEARRRRFQ